MNYKLKNIIKIVKSEFEKHPSSIIIGNLNDGLNVEEINDDLEIKIYNDFLLESNGGRFGAIDLWSRTELFKNQYRVIEIPGGVDKWVCIGQILYEPIVINKINGKVYRFYQGHEEEVSGDYLGDFDEFLIQYVFGDKYAEIIPDADEEEWYQFLREVNLVK